MAEVSPAGVVLFHGAGGDREHHTFLALEEQLGLPVRRINFPYRDKPGRRPPDRQPVLLTAVRDAAAAVAGELRCGVEQLVLGGRSMGGRMCSIAVAEGLPAAGLLLLSYPLHPPGKPDRLRTEHFGSIRVPTLFLAGDRDPFGSPAEIDAAVPNIAGVVSVEWLRGGHDPRSPDSEIVAAVRAWMVRTFGADTSTR